MHDHGVLWACSTMNVLHTTLRFHCWNCSEDFMLEVCVEWYNAPCPYCGQLNPVALPHERDIPRAGA